jgi:hypothetical protein
VRTCAGTPLPPAIDRLIASDQTTTPARATQALAPRSHHLETIAIPADLIGGAFLRLAGEH